MDENIEQAFSCLVASSGRLQTKEKDVPRPRILGWCKKSLHICPKSYSPSVVPDFKCPNNLTLIFELRSAY